MEYATEDMDVVKLKATAQLYGIRSRAKGLLTLVLIFVFGFSLAGSAQGGEKDVALTVYPCNDVVNSFKKFNPLVSYLTRETGHKVRLVFFFQYDNYRRALQNRGLDFVLQDPMVYQDVSDRFNTKSLLISLAPDGKPYQNGVIIVRKDSKINTIDALKGKRIIFGPKMSSPRWVAARLLFIRAGIDLDRDLKEYIHGGCCEDISFNVFMKSADAGVVCDHFLGRHLSKQQELGIDAYQIRVLAETPPVPTQVFIATKTVPQGVVEVVNRALLGLNSQNPERASVLKKTELGGFMKASDADHIRLKKDMAVLTAGGVRGQWRVPGLQP